MFIPWVWQRGLGNERYVQGKGVGLAPTADQALEIKLRFLIFPA